MKNSANKTQKEDSSDLLFLARLFVIAILFVVLAHYCKAQEQTSNSTQTLILENRNNHKQKVFRVGTKVRMSIEKKRTIRGRIKAISDSSVTVSHHGQKQMITENIQISRIASIAYAKKSFPVAFGSILLSSGVIFTLAGVSAESQAGGQGLDSWANSLAGAALIGSGTLLAAAGTPLVIPKRSYNTRDWQPKVTNNFVATPVVTSRGAWMLSTSLSFNYSRYSTYSFPDNSCWDHLVFFSGRAGYFVTENWALGLYASRISDAGGAKGQTAIGVFSRFYFPRKTFFGFGYQKIKPLNYTVVPMEFGFSKLITKRIAIEPAVNYLIFTDNQPQVFYANNTFGRREIGFNLGASIYFGKKGK
jgi:hypothetical protein